MTSGKVIPEVFAVHLAELAELWGQWREMLSADDETLAGVRDWEERISDHVDALLIHAEEVVPLLSAHLSGEDVNLIEVSAMLLLRCGPGGREAVMSAFECAEGPAIFALRDGLCQANLDGLKDRFKQVYFGEDVTRSLCAAYVFAFHGKLSAKHDGWKKRLTEEDPQIRRLAWQVAALLGG